MDPSKIDEDRFTDSSSLNSREGIPLATQQDLKNSAGGFLCLKLDSNREGIDWGASMPMNPLEPATDALDKAIEKPYHLDDK